MLKKRLLKITIKILLVSSILILLFSCDANLTGVEDSPNPGIVRVTLRSNPNDTYVIERTDTFTVFTPWDTLGFYVNISQGSVYKGEIFAVLYPSIRSYRQEDSVYNVFRQNTSKAELRNIAGKLDSGKVELQSLKADYKQYTIFESYVPPGKYNKLRFGVNVPSDLITGRVTLVSIDGKISSIPLELPEGESLLKDFEVDFEVSENKVTQINIEISPFQSISRFRDSYLFGREMKVLGVDYL